MVTFSKDKGLLFHYSTRYRGHSQMEEDEVTPGFRKEKEGRSSSCLVSVHVASYVHLFRNKSSPKPSLKVMVVVLVDGSVTSRAPDLQPPEHILLYTLEYLLRGFLRYY